MAHAPTCPAYRIVDKCTGDAGYLASYRQRDVEVWMAGSQEFMEVMTDTNTSDYQARRLNIRYRGNDRKVRHCHTVTTPDARWGACLSRYSTTTSNPRGRFGYLKRFAR